MHILSGKAKNIDRSRERCVFFLNFVIFFNSENSSTYFKERERERDWYMHILAGKAKYIDRSRERCVFFFNFVICLTLRTRLRISNFRGYLCKKNLINEMSLSDYITL